MTILEPTPNPAFWQALEAYLSRRIVAAIAAPEREPDKDAELLYPHPVNEQEPERVWYVEEYLVEPMDELTF